MAHGVLPKHMLRKLFELGHLAELPDYEKYLNPASIDLPLSDQAWRLKSSFLPPAARNIRIMLSELGATEHDLKKPLEVGVSYLIKIDGSNKRGHWQLPPGIYGYINPKSSIGRLFLMVKAVADGVDMYDALVNPEPNIGGWEGELWVLVRPDAFPVVLTPGIALSQLRLFTGPSFLDRYAMDREIDQQGLLFDERGLHIKKPRRHTDSFFLTLQAKGQMGWICKNATEPLDLSKPTGFYDPADYFDPIVVENDSYQLLNRQLYLLSTRERLLVPPHLSAELRPIDVRFFDGRVHAAGYIDPGWGYEEDGSGNGRPITLEVFPFEDLLVSHGQNIARVRYERMKEPPEVAYNAGNSNYSGQEGATLAKWFKK